MNDHNTKTMSVSELTAAFNGYFPQAGTVGACRAPGRINLIGEHTDYNGLPVLPMTLSQDICIAFAPRSDGQVRMRNTDPRYPETTFTNASSLAPSPRGSWENYCKAGVQALNNRFRLDGKVGMDMLVTGTVPVAAGLSSSSALVVACSLAYLGALGLQLEKDITRLELAAILAEGEHYVGTQGGGMDQAIILLGGAADACKIDFFPLRVERVALPKGYTFVACNSLVKAEKTGEALHRYNAGPRMCKLICALVEHQAREEFGEEIEFERLGDLWNGHLCLTHSEAWDLIDRVLPRETTPLAEAARTLGTTVDKIRELWLGDLREPSEGFRLRSRARHLTSEFRRVEAARDALLSGDAETFGSLMDDSHRSCREDYEISCAELDELVAIARDAGAVGARLTGAGFGGCTVNLVPTDRLESFRKQVEARYYSQYLSGRDLPNLPHRIIEARAAEGAGFLAANRKEWP